VNPLTWQNPEQLFVAQVLKKIFYNSVAELRITMNGLVTRSIWKKPSSCMTIFIPDGPKSWGEESIGANRRKNQKTLVRMLRLLFFV